MPYSIQIRHKAITLRKRGFSIKEIAAKLQIAQSTSSLWLSHIALSKNAQKRLASRRILGQYKSIQIKKIVKDNQRKMMEKYSLEILSRLSPSKEFMKLCCALVWWCEGNKDTKSVKFTSSDTTLIRNFLYFLRSGFDIDETKFRALVHIHKYHNDLAQKKFWSEITKIPLAQFYNSYRKPNTGRRFKENYPGCLAVAYYDAKIAKELEALYNTFSKLGASVNW
ncbi:helix-turn-helix domain-containing protein [Patescibacteria group bacterium]|nr:helix-turn-helix domain-containing protein [Patescibacteria group bacterium]MCL5409442.1 helix-turn-helix domain-containing protein [Patescibacteria group bacterium]